MPLPSPRQRWVQLASQQQEQERGQVRGATLLRARHRRTGGAQRPTRNWISKSMTSCWSKSYLAQPLPASRPGRLRHQRRRHQQVNHRPTRPPARNQVKLPRLQETSSVRPQLKNCSTERRSTSSTRPRRHPRRSKSKTSQTMITLMMSLT